MGSNREENLEKAKLAEQIERYDKMADFMEKVARSGSGLNTEERNLFSVAFKNVVGARRSSWRVISSIEEKTENAHKIALANKYKAKIEGELTDICKNVIDILDSCLIPQATKSQCEGETMVFFHKMKGDYNRYLAEVYRDAPKKEAINRAEDAYETASEIAKSLKTTHPIRLGLALNHSVFYYEIIENREKACHLAKLAFDEAIADLDTLPENTYKDSTLIMQLLRDNLTLWSTEDQEDVMPDDEGN